MSMHEPLPPIRKIAAIVPFSDEELRFFGFTREGDTPPPPPSRRTRLRWARQTWWHNHRPHLHLGPCDHEGRL